MIKNKLHKTYPAVFMTTTGLFLLLLASINCYPMIHVARLLSEDQTLTSSFLEKMQRSHQLLAWIFLFLSPVGFFASDLDQRLYRTVMTCPKNIFYAGLGLIVFTVTFFTQEIIFDGIPHVTDAIAHYFQAKILCLGQLYAPAPPCYENFAQHHVLITQTGKWFGKYTPGHALLLAAGIKVHLDHLILPLANTIIVILLMEFTLKFYSVTISRVVGMLYCLSPLVYLLGGSFMSHTTFLCAALLTTYFVVHALEPPVVRRSFALAAGFTGGWAALIRPQDFAVWCVILFLGFLFSTHLWKRWVTLGVFAIIGFLPIACLWAWWNDQLYGHAIAIGYGFTKTDYLTPPFQGYFGFSEFFTPDQAILFLTATTARFNRVLLGWPSSLLFIPIAFLAWKPNRKDIFCLLAAGIFIATYFFYSYYGMEYEARYYYNTIPFALVLTARGLRQTIQRLGHRARPGLLLLLLVFFTHGAIDYVYGYLWPHYGQDYEQSSTLLNKLARERRITNAVVLIESTGEQGLRYSSGFIYNDPLLKSDIVYARDLPGKNHCLNEAFPGKTIYRFIPSSDWNNGEFIPVDEPHKNK